MFDRAAAELAAKLKELAADELEVSPSDLEIADGGLRVKGTDRALGFAANRRAAGRDARSCVWGRANSRRRCRPIRTAPMSARSRSIPRPARRRSSRYTICDDFGTILNPLLLAGQVHGGIAQGIGQALCERDVYGDDGQLITCKPDGLLSAAGGGYAVLRIRNTQRAIDDQSARPQRGGRSRLDRRRAGGDECGRRCAHRAFGIAAIDMPATPARIAELIRGIR